MSSTPATPADGDLRTPEPPPRSRTAWTLRGVTAAGVLLSADVHLVQYVQGYRDIDVIGPLFGLNVVAGLALGLLLLVWRHWLPLAGAVAFAAATLLAFYLSATVGLFDVQATPGGTQEILAAVAEWVALAAGSAALVVEARRRRARAARPPT